MKTVWTGIFFNGKVINLLSSEYQTEHRPTAAAAKAWQGKKAGPGLQAVTDSKGLSIRIKNNPHISNELVCVIPFEPLKMGEMAVFP